MFQQELSIIIPENEHITANPDIRGGVLCLTGTRITIAQVIAEIADDRTVSDIASDLGLEKYQITAILQAIAMSLDKTRATAREDIT